MNGQEIISHLRESVLDDVNRPYLWGDVELLRLANYAEVQVCRRANLIIDSTTEDDADEKPLCVLTIVANQAVYNLSPKILQVKRCQLKSMTYPLNGPVLYPQLDEQMSGWLGTSGTVGTAGSGGVPTSFLNEPGNTITFVLAPSVSDTAYLVVSRLPLTPFTLETSPEIDEQYHIGLCDWAAHLAYMKPDSETLNLNLAKVYEDRFTAQFGSLPDARTEKLRKTLSQRQRFRPRTFGS